MGQMLYFLFIIANHTALYLHCDNTTVFPKHSKFGRAANSSDAETFSGLKAVNTPDLSLYNFGFAGSSCANLTSP